MSNDNDKRTSRGGPRVRLDLSCSGCAYERTEKYVAQGDSGHEVNCARFDPPRYVGDTTWTTPDWCPLRGRAIELALSAIGFKREGGR